MLKRLRPRILITGASSRLAQAIAARLSRSYDLRLIDSVPFQSDHETILCNILDPDQVPCALRKIDVLIHTGEPPPDLPDDPLTRDQMILDFATRGTHVLFSAAVKAGVKRFVYASTLEIFRNYPDDVYLSELWKPLPSSDMTTMAKYLGELVCREFTRENFVTATSLRLGKLVLADEVKSQTPDLAWLDISDAAEAFRLAVKRDVPATANWVPRWEVFHIGANWTNPRFLIDKAKSELKYEPSHCFDSVGA